MNSNLGTKPAWLTFDCYGTLTQWDEGLIAAVRTILSKQGAVAQIDAKAFIEVFDKHEHALEQERPHKRFREVASESLRRAMAELGRAYDPAYGEILTSSISKMPPFPEVVNGLSALKRMGFRLCIISNTDDDIIAGNVAKLGGHIDTVITAELSNGTGTVSCHPIPNPDLALPSTYHRGHTCSGLPAQVCISTGS